MLGILARVEAQAVGVVAADMDKSLWRGWDALRREAETQLAVGHAVFVIGVAVDERVVYQLDMQDRHGP
jgi:hypothetical protein